MSSLDYYPFWCFYASRRILAPINKPDKMAVVHVTRTNRQNVIFSENGNWGDSEPECYSAGYHQYFGVKQDFQVADTLINIKRMLNRDKFIENFDIYLTTYKDSFCAVNTTLFGADYESPNIFKAAEDVSQIVDKIRFNTFLNKDVITMLVGILGDLLYKIGIFRIFEHKRLSWIITILAVIIGLFIIYLMYTKANSASQEVERTMTITK